MLSAQLSPLMADRSGQDEAGVGFRNAAVTDGNAEPPLLTSGFSVFSLPLGGTVDCAAISVPGLSLSPALTDPMVAAGSAEAPGSLVCRGACAP